jgi:hypothetical protein
MTNDGMTNDEWGEFGEQGGGRESGVRSQESGARAWIGSGAKNSWLGGGRNWGAAGD